MAEQERAAFPGYAPGKKTKAWKKKALTHYDLYLLLIPGLAYLIVFKYVPMYGLIIAFKDFNVFKGIGGSPWVGLEHFRNLFHSSDFYLVLRNTLLISLYKIVILFPIPIVIALFLNEVKSLLWKKTVQTVIYLPHFLSWVVIAGLFVNILSPSGGLINQLIVHLGGQPVKFLLDNDWFRSVLVATAGWKDSGWNAIIFLAAIAGIDQEQYEAAKMDGAGRLRMMTSITLPGIATTIFLMLIIRLGSILEAGTEQILLLYNPSVYQSGDVIGTYIYRMGLGNLDYSFSAAVGFFNSVVGFILVVSGNYASKKYAQKGVW
ncbi:ABC transporter permease [Paenibacillus cymbidii]|uniref:ABC transporter permease n=1 Tax=Paenibacillus cymbidii TaxID=1639034 RepID=UPI0010801F6C|nr:ABC transporter permease subunit [Paenibacillus cymbidii]